MTREWRTDYLNKVPTWALRKTTKGTNQKELERKERHWNEKESKGTVRERLWEQRPMEFRHRKTLQNDWTRQKLLCNIANSDIVGAIVLRTFLTIGDIADIPGNILIQPQDANKNYEMSTFFVDKFFFQVVTLNAPTV